MLGRSDRCEITITIFDKRSCWSRPLSNKAVVTCNGYCACYVGPNISGKFEAARLFNPDPAAISQEGAFYTKNYEQGSGAVPQSDTGRTGVLRLDASKSNALYDGTKVQTPALQLLACIRC